MKLPGPLWPKSPQIEFLSLKFIPLIFLGSGDPENFELKVDLSFWLGYQEFLGRIYFNDCFTIFSWILTLSMRVEALEAGLKSLPSLTYWSEPDRMDLRSPLTCLLRCLVYLVGWMM
jgi:hypothetical protein